MTHKAAFLKVVLDEKGAETLNCKSNLRIALELESIKRDALSIALKRVMNGFAPVVIANGQPVWYFNGESVQMGII